MYKNFLEVILQRQFCSNYDKIVVKLNYMDIIKIIILSSKVSITYLVFFK